MTAPIIQANYEYLNKVARSFDYYAEVMFEMLRQVQGVTSVLEAGAWCGVGAGKFFDEMHSLVEPSVKRLGDALREANHAVVRLVQIFQSAEHEAGQLFHGDFTPDREEHIAEYSETVFDWEIVGDMASYTPDNGWIVANDMQHRLGLLLNQKGPSCSLYSIMNLFTLNGMPIDGETVEKYANEILGKREPPETLQTMSHGFRVREIRALLDEKFPGRVEIKWIADEVKGDGAHLAAEQFLIKNLTEGRPINVVTKPDNTFGIEGVAHSYNVIGVKVDEEGHLQSVLVHTNWESDDFLAIDADDFMKDWQAEGFQYRIVNFS